MHIIIQTNDTNIVTLSKTTSALQKVIQFSGVANNAYAI